MKGIAFIIGSEILDGKTEDTDSIFLYKFCQKFAVEIEKKLILKDEERIIINSINKEINDFDFFFFIGGLGPTFDDLTLDSVAKAFNLPIQFDEKQIDKINKFLSSRNISDEKLINLNLRQARYIENPLKNSKGMALGSYFKIDSNKKLKHFFLLPGPKVEFETMLDEEVSKILKLICKNRIHQKNIYVYNVSESSLNNLLNSMGLKTLYGIYAKEHLKVLTFQSKDINLINQDFIKLLSYENLLGYYLKDFNNDFVFNKSNIDKMQFFPDLNLIITDEIDFKDIFYNFVKNKGLAFSAAESCSGGLLSQLITSIPSASNNFLGSVVCYSAFSKEKILKVNKNIIDKFGTVSPEITEILAINSKNLFNSDFAISITGFAGPEGGTDLYPVGTCFIGISKNNKDKTKDSFSNTIDISSNKLYRCNFKGNRQTIQNLAVVFSMFLAIYNLYD
jgi:nicotinamide-nucleotide amidase